MRLKLNTVVFTDTDTLLGKIVRLIVNRRGGFNEIIPVYNVSKDMEGHYKLEKGDLDNVILAYDEPNDNLINKAKYYKIDVTLVSDTTSLRDLWDITSFEEFPDCKPFNEEIFEWILNMLDNKGNKNENRLLKIYMDTCVNPLVNGQAFFNLTCKEILTYANAFDPDSKENSNKNTFEFVVSVESTDLESAILEFKKSYPDLKDRIETVLPVKNGRNIAYELETKDQLESLMLINKSYYDQRINKMTNENIVLNNDMLYDVGSVITATRNALTKIRNKG